MAKVLNNYKIIAKYFGNSTKKLRLLKEIEIEIDIFSELELVQKNVTKELRKLVANSKEARQLLAKLSSQENIELELESSEPEIEEAILHDEKLQCIEEKLEVMNEQMEKLEKKREIAETKAKKNSWEPQIEIIRI